MLPQAILDRAYTAAERAPALAEHRQAWVDVLIEYVENHKAVMTVVITSLVKKIEQPQQDIRLHKTEMPGGYSGRSYDTQHITPFMRARFGRLAMAESGWLTRSIEQAHPFTLDFPGKIRNPAVKAAFLGILDDVETKRADAFTYLAALLYGLRQAHARDVSLLISLRSMPTALDVVEIVTRLEALFSTNFDEAGAARLPVLALYAIYQCLTGHYRYEGKRLSPLKSHTASDERSRTYGDIEVLDGDGSPFEAVEVKYDRPIDRGMLTIAAQKIAGSGLRRYLLLTTHDPNISDDGVLHLAQAIRARDDCEVIVNGVLPTLKYYLRLLDTPQAFLKAFHEVLEADFTQNTDIKRSHVERWQSLLQD